MTVAAPSPPAARGPVSVGVTVDLHRGHAGGGHVKCWERFAQAAASLPEALDLTVYFLGQSERTEAIAANVRIVELPPAFGTNRLPFLKAAASDTDLAVTHRGLARRLDSHEVLHATSAFSLSRTAALVAQRTGRPLASSIHTDLPTFTRVYTSAILRRNLGDALGGLIAEQMGFARFCEARMRRQVLAILKASRRVLVSKPADAAWLVPLIGERNVSRLRRGVDSARFSPGLRDRPGLAARYGVPAEGPLLLFVGRVDASKGAGLMAEAARRLLDDGRDLHVLVVGTGGEAERVKALLGAHATLTGGLPQDELPAIYASADLFVFPSESEEMPNVLLEAKASGLPIIVSAHPGSAQCVQRPGHDGVVVERAGAKEWAAALRPLLDDEARRAAIGRAARAECLANWPDWPVVLAEDLLPVWQALARPLAF